MNLGKSLIFIGLAVSVLGALVIFLPKIPFLGRLPGDIVIKRENFTFYFPLATGLLISLLLTLIFRLFKR